MQTSDFPSLLSPSRQSYVSVVLDHHLINWVLVAVSVFSCMLTVGVLWYYADIWAGSDSSIGIQVFIVAVGILELAPYPLYVYIRYKYQARHLNFYDTYLLIDRTNGKEELYTQTEHDFYIFNVELANDSAMEFTSGYPCKFIVVNKHTHTVSFTEGINEDVARALLADERLKPFNITVSKTAAF